MAAVYISEYSAIANVSIHLLGIMSAQSKTQTPAAQEPCIADQVVAISGSSTQSSEFNAQTTMIRINTDAVCSIAIGPNPTASATSKRLSANTTEYFGVQRGHKVAVITNV